MPSTFIKGEDLILYVWVTDEYLPVACLTSNSITKTRSVIETVTKCDPGVVVRGAGSRSYEVPFEGVYIDTGASGDTTKASWDSLLALFDTDDELTWKMSSGLIDTVAYYGTGIFTQLDMTAGSGDEFATFSGSISGSGAIATVDPQAS